MVGLLEEFQVTEERNPMSRTAPTIPRLGEDCCLILDGLEKIIASFAEAQSRETIQARSGWGWACWWESDPYTSHSVQGSEIPA